MKQLTNMLLLFIAIAFVNTQMQAETIRFDTQTQDIEVIKRYDDPLLEAVENLNVKKTQALLQSRILRLEYKQELLEKIDKIAKVKKKNAQSYVKQIPRALIGASLTMLGIATCKYLVQTPKIKNLTKKISQSHPTFYKNIKTTDKQKKEDKDATLKRTIQFFVGITAISTITSSCGLVQFYKALTRSNSQSAYEKALTIKLLLYESKTIA